MHFEVRNNKLTCFYPDISGPCWRKIGKSSLFAVLLPPNSHLLSATHLSGKKESRLRVFFLFLRATFFPSFSTPRLGVVRNVLSPAKNSFFPKSQKSRCAKQRALLLTFCFIFVCSNAWIPILVIWFVYLLSICQIF